MTDDAGRELDHDAEGVAIPNRDRRTGSRSFDTSAVEARLGKLESVLAEADAHGAGLGSLNARLAHLEVAPAAPKTTHAPRP